MFRPPKPSSAAPDPEPPEPNGLSYPMPPAIPEVEYLGIFEKLYEGAYPNVPSCAPIPPPEYLYPPSPPPIAGTEELPPIIDAPPAAPRIEPPNPPTPLLYLGTEVIPLIP